MVVGRTRRSMPYEARSTGNGFVVDDGSDAPGVTSTRNPDHGDGQPVERARTVRAHQRRHGAGGLHDRRNCRSLAAAGSPWRPLPTGCPNCSPTASSPPPIRCTTVCTSLAAGDQLEATARDGDIEVDLSHDFPWGISKSRQDQEPDTTRFMSLLADATDRQVAAAGGQGVLCLSSGKDSVAVAVALAQSGNTQVPCVTFSAHEDDTEYLYAQGSVRTPRPRTPHREDADRSTRRQGPS